MLFLAKYTDQGDVLVDADDADQAMRALVSSGVEGRPSRLQVVPPGIFVAEVRWAELDEVPDEDENPADHAQSGLVFEPFEPLAEYLEIDAKAGRLEEHALTVVPEPVEDASG